jgi:hypothetical protein
MTEAAKDGTAVAGETQAPTSDEPQATRAATPVVVPDDIDEMGVLQRKTKLFRVHIGKSSWVDAKAKFSIGDRAAIQQSTVTGKIVTRQGQEVELGSLSLGNSVIQTLIQSVMNWGGPAFCRTDHSDDPVKEGHRCEPVALTPENLAIMSEPAAQKVLTEVNRRNPAPVADSANPTNGSERKS